MKRARLFSGLVLCISLAAFSLFNAQAAQAAEKILSFDSQLQVMQDGSMEVTETITVRAEGRNIKRGIYRDFPTRYKDRLGHKYVVDFEVLQILKDGKKEPYHIKGQSNGERVYMGSKDVMLRPGVYTYTIKYRTDRQLGFFENHDELYWNVTGNGWDFEIGEATASVHLPPGIPSGKVQFEAYTGYQGDQGRAYEAWSDGGPVSFKTTVPLQRNQGLTIVVTWPKGYVHEPSAGEKMGYLFRDNFSLFVGLGGLLQLFLYYFIVWMAVGKDPAKGTIIPRYDPPKDLSPAAVRFIRKMGFDNKCFAVGIINLAVKGLADIKEDENVFTIKKLERKEQPLFKAESKLYNKLPSSLKLKNTNHSKVQAAQKALKSALKLQSEKIHFIKNTKYMVFGIILTFGILIATTLSESFETTAIVIFALIWLSLWSVGVFMLGAACIGHWRTLFSGQDSLASVVGAVMTTIIFIPFFGGEIAGLFFLGTATSTGIVVILVLLALVNVLFYHWMKAPTHAGRKLLDEIEGFRMFLSVTERERLNFVHPPEKTPELFEKFLPYALALDVEQLWAEQFSEVLKKAGQGGEAYTPRWYHGDFATGNYGAMASSMASGFTSAISSASTAPGSSSGSSSFGGGGSSGGGGGGGGGGGW